MRTYTDPASVGLRVKTPTEVRTILAELRRRLEALYGERLRGLFLFGSYVRGEAEPGSDLDVLVVLDEVESYWDELERGGHITADLSLEHDLTISRILMSEAQWSGGDTPLLRSIRREGRSV